MNTILQENIEYRHKKFDQTNKRSHTDSSSSSGADNEEYTYIKQELEKMEETTFTEDAPIVDLSTRKSRSRKRSTAAIDSKDFAQRAKRLRRDSFSPSLSLPSNRPLPVAVNAAAATVIPPTTAILPKISEETLLSICKYHGNMVRSFPKKERTAKDQERRNKNTIACRMSRRVKKLEHIAIEEQYKEFSQQAFDITEKAIRATAYLHELINLMNCNTTAVKEETPISSIKLPTLPATSSEKKPFSIPFLAGKE